MRHRRTLEMIIVVAMLAAACGNDASVPSTNGEPGTQAPTTQTEATSTPEPTSTSVAGVAASYAIVDTGQVACYDEQGVITCPEDDEPFFGQDGSYTGSQPTYVDHGDGTVTDLVTGLMWQQDPGDKMTYDEAAAGAGSSALAGYDDWRLPTIKELYSLIDFSGTDPSACQSAGGCGAIPFIDDVFAFAYGDTSNGERLIDSQWATSSIYEGLTMGGDETVFGVNFADGRIKGYPMGADPSGADKQFFVVYVRGNEAYGQNDLVDNGDGTVSDLATLLMWQQFDSAGGMEWEESLVYCEALETASYDDWRLPNAKELQSIVDYTRSPQSTGSAAIDPVFETTAITDEGGGLNFGMYWSSTTHVSMQGGQNAVYVAFGEALGYMTGPRVGDATLMDVHGAGAQRSDPKTGDASDYPTGHGPQGDVIRIDNMVRCVRSGDVETTTGLLVEAAVSTGDTGQMGQETEPPASGGPLAEAAAALGVSESALAGAMGDPTQGPPDFDEVARTLGVSVEELMAALPVPPAGG